MKRCKAEGVSKFENEESMKLEGLRKGFGKIRILAQECVEYAP